VNHELFNKTLQKLNVKLAKGLHGISERMAEATSWRNIHPNVIIKVGVRIFICGRFK